MNTKMPPPDPEVGALEMSTPLNPSQKTQIADRGGPAYVHPARSAEHISPVLQDKPEWSLLATAYESAMPGGLTVRRTGPAHNSHFYSVSEFSRQPAGAAVFQQPRDVAHVGLRPEEPAANGRARTKTRYVQDKFWDPQTPYILLLYLQLFFNIVIVSLVLVLLYRFVTTVRADVHGKVESYTLDAVREISRCLREYFRNRCSLENRAPALEQTCMRWEKCMNRDPQKIGRSQITAETFAEIVDGFLRPISWKALVFFTLLTLGALVATNVGFGSYRRYARQENKRVEWLEEQLQSMQDEFTRDKSRAERVLAASTPFPQPAARFLDSSMLHDSPLLGKERR